MVWQPPERPRFLQRLIEHGEAVGGASNLVSLDAEELIDVARASCGLSDFGGAAWREPYHIFLRALEDESELHLVGRLVARTEILQTLRNRLQLADLWSRHPELLDAEIEAPVFIVGSPRSGTSILHELMATDPLCRAPAMWEMQRPVDAALRRNRAASVDLVTQFWHDMQPEYETMHANSGHLPNECIFITLHEFLSDHWGGNHVVPSYDAHLQKADLRPAYRYHRDFLKTLQAAGGSRRWLLKAPSHLFQLRALFDVYPDARIVRTHRDPRKTLASAISLLGTLKWMRCNRVDMSAAPALLAFGYGYIYEQEIAQRESGVLPDDRFIDVQFADIVADPAGTVARVYERLGWAWGSEARDRVAAYARSKPRASRGVHRYSLEQVGLVASEVREQFAFYREHYDIPEEPD
jgi:hypothetical protein